MNRLAAAIVVWVMLMLMGGSVAAQAPPATARPALEQFIYVLRPIARLQTEANWTELDSAIAQRHFAHLQELTAKGVVIHAGRTTVLDSKTFGLVIFEASSADEAKRVMESDPAVKDGIMTAEVFPYKIVLRRTEQ
jgi:uncharacterized protein YciI